MNQKALLLPLCCLCLLLFAGSAQAQWQTTAYTLKGGWNAIYLSGDATQDTIENLFPDSGTAAAVQEIWRWNPNPAQVQFTESPLIPAPGTPEWSVWVRGGTANTLTQLTGQMAYLVRCTGTTATTYPPVSLKQKVLPPRSTWVRNGANLMGFPSLKSTNPFFSNYFATFPAAIAASTKIYKYVGGDLGAGNPLQIFSPTAERLDPTKAYWFSAEVVGDFTAPLEISPSSSGGLSFGSTGATATLRVRNRTAAVVTLTLTPVNSESRPASQADVVGPVPLSRRTFNTSSGQWTATDISSPFTVDISPQSTAELSFDIRRTAMSGSAGDFFASFLRLTDGGNLMEVMLPVSASKESLAGLWVGDVSLTNVSSQVRNTAKAAATVSGGRVTALTVSGTGGFGYSTPPAVTIDAPLSGATATATASISGGAVIGFTITNAGTGYAVASPRVTIAPPPALSGTGTPRTFTLRTLLHVTQGGAATLLSKVFIGPLASAGHDVGITTRQVMLQQDALDRAQRLVAAHLPLDQVIPCSGSTLSTLTCTIPVQYDDPTNPFVHQYHPDHDNKDARFQPVGAGVESYTITRTCTFTFSPTPPLGSTATTGWGSSVIGGSYSETITGLHKNPLQLDGTFQLRRASEIGTLTP